MIELGAGGNILEGLDPDAVISIMKLIVHDFFQSEDHEMLEREKNDNPEWKKDWGPFADEEEDAIINFIQEKRRKKATNDDIIFYLFWRTYENINRMTDARDFCPNCGRSCWERFDEEVKAEEEGEEETKLRDAVEKYFEEGEEGSSITKVAEAFVEVVQKNASPGSLIEDVKSELEEEMIHDDERDKIGLITTEAWIEFKDEMYDNRLERAIEKHVRERLKSNVSEKVIWFDLWMIIRNAFEIADDIFQMVTPSEIERMTIDDLKNLKESMQKEE